MCTRHALRLVIETGRSGAVTHVSVIFSMLLEGEGTCSIDIRISPTGIAGTETGRIFMTIITHKMSISQGFGAKNAKTPTTPSRAFARMICSASCLPRRRRSPILPPRRRYVDADEPAFRFAEIDQLRIGSDSDAF